MSMSRRPAETPPRQDWLTKEMVKVLTEALLAQQRSVGVASGLDLRQPANPGGMNEAA